MPTPRRAGPARPSGCAPATWRAAAAAALAAALAACGGGGGDNPAPLPPASVVGTSIALLGSANVQPQWGREVLLTLQGENLEAGAISVTNPSCAGLSRSTASPYVSSATTAYYRCTVTAVGTGRFEVRRVADNSVLRSAEYPVPAPQVSLTVSNGAGVGGTLVATLDTRAPVTARNFLDYVNAGFYDGTVFHRNSPGFVLQAGGYAAPVTAAGLPAAKPTNAPIVLEDNVGLSNLALTLSMARTGAPDSATAQFFVNLVDNSAVLDRNGSRNPTGRGYAVFGTVTDNAGLVAQIAGAPCVAAPAFLFAGECLPSPNVVITAARQTR